MSRAKLPEIGGTRMNRLAQDPALRRRVFLGAAAAATAGTLLATVILMILALTTRADLADRMAETGVAIAGATLLLAVIAAIVALLAYAVSTGAPDIDVSIRVPLDGRPNNFEFEVEPGSPRHSNGQAVTDTEVFAVKAFQQLVAMIQLRNLSRYSAVNPAVIVRLQAMMFTADSLAASSNHWVSVEFASRFSIRAVQWDGGPWYPIHGDSTRRLPDLHLNELRILPEEGTPAFVFEILADGFRRTVTVPVRFHQFGEPYVETAGAGNPAWMLAEHRADPCSRAVGIPRVTFTHAVKHHVASRCRRSCNSPLLRA